MCAPECFIGIALMIVGVLISKYGRKFAQTKLDELEQLDCELKAEQSKDIKRNG